MTLPLTDAELLARHQRRRRLIVRITLGMMLVLLLLGLGGLALTSSGMSIEEAEAACKRIGTEKITESLAESVFGKPIPTPVKHWLFTRWSLDTVEKLVVVVNSDGLSARIITGRQILTGWDAWKFRWYLLKLRLGFKVD